MSYNTILATAPLTTQNYHLKMIGTSIGNSLIWDNGTNVGIGNTNTSYTLDVSGTGRFTGATYLATTSGNVGIGLTNPTGGKLCVESGGSDTLININNTTTNGSALYLTVYTSGSLVSSGKILQDNSGNMRFNTGTSSDTEKMRITSAGNVGIGTSSPNARLSLGNTTSTAKLLLYDGGFTGSGGNGYFAGFAIDSPSANDTTLLSHYQGALVFGRYTNANDTSAITERMRITSGGLVGIANSGINACRLAVTYGGGGSIAVGVAIQDVDNANGAQYMQFLNAATTAIGSISRNGGFNQINYNTTSDYRLKEDFKDFNGIEKVTSIKVYDHKWIGFEGRSNGVIAHELAEVLPYAVTGEKDAVDENENIKPQQVDYSKLVPVLVKAIQEMNAKLDEQNQTIQNLQEQINILAK